VIKILFFGVVAEKIGKREAVVSTGKILADVIAELGCADIQPLLVAVNQEQTTDMDYVLKDGDEVALMPPFSGG